MSRRGEGRGPCCPDYEDLRENRDTWRTLAIVRGRLLNEIFARIYTHDQTLGLANALAMVGLHPEPIAQARQARQARPGGMASKSPGERVEPTPSR